MPECCWTGLSGYLLLAKLMVAEYDNPSEVFLLSIFLSGERPATLEIYSFRIC
jgi:hypothetical protein